MDFGEWISKGRGMGEEGGDDGVKGGKWCFLKTILTRVGRGSRVFPVSFLVYDKNSIARIRRERIRRFFR